MKALLVDDSHMMRQTIAGILNAHGWEFIEAETGEQAVARICVHKGVDLIVLAREMSEMDGMEFLTWLRDIPEFVQDPKVMMVGDDSSVSAILKAMAAGANEYIMKPFGSDIFLHKMQVMGLMPTDILIKDDALEIDVGLDPTI